MSDPKDTGIFTALDEGALAAREIAEDVSREVAGMAADTNVPQKTEQEHEVEEAQKLNEAARAREEQERQKQQEQERHKSDRER